MLIDGNWEEFVRLTAKWIGSERFLSHFIHSEANAVKLMFSAT